VIVIPVGTLAKMIAIWSARLLRLWNAGEQPFTIVAIDTDDRLGLDAIPPSGVEWVDDYMPTMMHLDISLPSFDDVVAATERGELPHLSPYLPALRLCPRGGEEAAGARNLPAIGAASALFHTRTLSRALTTVLRRAFTEEGRPPLFVLVRLETGGTGTGATPVVARVLREIAESEGIPARLWLLSVASALFSGGSEDRARANAYATRKELVAHAHLFDLVIEVGDVAPAGGVALDSAQVLGQVAFFLALLAASGLGEHLQQRLPDEVVDFIKPGSVWAMGLATIYAPLREGKAWVTELATAFALERLLNGLEISDESFETKVEAFLQNVLLTPSADHLLRALDSPEEIAPNPSGNSPSVRNQVMAVVHNIATDDAWLTVLLEVEARSGTLLEICAHKFAENLHHVQSAIVGRLEKGLVDFCRRFGFRGAAQALDAALQRLGDYRQAIAGDQPPQEFFAPDAIAKRLGEVDAELLEIASKLRDFQQRNRLFRLFRRHRLKSLLARGAQLFDEKAELIYAQALCTTFVGLLDNLSAVFNEQASRLQTLIDDLDATRQALRQDGDRLFSHSFLFQIPVGTCLARPPFGDPQRFLQLFWTEEAEKAVLAEFWSGCKKVDWRATSLTELVKDLVRNRLREPDANIFSICNDMDAALRSILRQSGELLVLDESVAHDAPRLCFVITPSFLHDELRSRLHGLNEAIGGQGGWVLLDSACENFVVFAQLRLGIPLVSVKQNRVDFFAYQRQSQADKVELRHTRPAWRYLPEIVPQAIWAEAAELWEELAKLLNDDNPIELLRRFDELAASGQFVFSSEVSPRLLRLLKRYQGNEGGNEKWL